jgi:hypothetical protein
MPRRFDKVKFLRFHIDGNENRCLNSSEQLPGFWSGETGIAMRFKSVDASVILDFVGGVILQRQAQEYLKQALAEFQRLELRHKEQEAKEVLEKLER